MGTRELQASNTPRDGYTTRITYTTGPNGPESTRVEVEGEEGSKVTGQILREVPVTQLMRQHLAQHPEVAIGETADLKMMYEMLHHLGADAEGPTKVMLQIVRQLYGEAAAQGKPPARAVADTLGLSIATAGRRIRQSKQVLGWG